MPCCAGIVLGCICSLCMVVIAGALLGRRIRTQHYWQGSADKQATGAGKELMPHGDGSQHRACGSGALAVALRGDASDQASLSQRSEIAQDLDPVAAVSGQRLCCTREVLVGSTQ